MPVVYLDLNHWIQLAKARTGHPNGVSHVSLWELLIDLTCCARVVTPLSATHYMEIADIKDVRQRADIAITMGLLSGYTTLASRDVLLRVELRQALGRRFDRDVPQLSQADVLGYGAGNALGEPMRLTLSGGPPSNLTAESVGTYVAAIEKEVGYGWSLTRRNACRSLEELLYAVSDEAAEHFLLRGPDAEDEAVLRERFGYHPEASRALATTITDRDRKLAEDLKVEPESRARLDDILGARVTFWDLAHVLGPLLAEVGLDWTSFMKHGKEWLLDFLDDVPILVVETALRSRNFKNVDHRWTVNDIRDFHGLGAAVPYCSVVLTERHSAATLKAAHVGERYAAVILRRPQELEEYLANHWTHSSLSSN